jgi:hypothetical protein
MSIRGKVGGNKISREFSRRSFNQVKQKILGNVEWLIILGMWRKFEMWGKKAE